MFLEKIPYQSVRRRRIRDWPLLAMRLAAILLIVLAFARPFFDKPIAALAGAAGPREVVILLDRSYSMGYGDRWARAQAAARQAVQGLTSTDHATLILFGTNAQAEVRGTADVSRMIGAIDSARVSAEATRYAPALKLAQRVLADSTLQTREVVMISDFQRNGWVRDENLRLPEGTTFRTAPITDAQTANLTVSTVLPQRSLFSGQERVTVAASVVNRGPAAVNNVQVRLELDGRQVESQTISVPPGAPASVTFPPFTLARAFTRGTVRIGDDALKQDNAYHFVVSPAQRLPVLLVEPARAPRDASLHLQKALAIGTAPQFQVDVRQGESVASTDLDRHRVVILNDVAALSSGADLKNFVSKGGGLLVLLGERANWGTDSNDILPALPGNLVDRPGHGGALAELDRSHPVLDLFKAPRSGNLSTARFFRYRAVALKPEPAGDKEGEHGPNNRVIARFDDGAIAMAERRIGSGHVVLWASTLDNYWNDLALKPVYLPFVHEVIRHLATYEQPKNWLTVGEVIDPGHLLRASGIGMQSGTGAMILDPERTTDRAIGSADAGTARTGGLLRSARQVEPGRHGKSCRQPRHARIGSRSARPAGTVRRALRASRLGEPRGSRCGDPDAGRSGAPPELLVVPVDGWHRAARPRNRDLEPHERACRRHTHHTDGCVGKRRDTHERLALSFLFRTIFRDARPAASTRIAAIGR